MKNNCQITYCLAAVALTLSGVARADIAGDNQQTVVVTPQSTQLITEETVSEAKINLINKINVLPAFTAHFNQNVFDVDGNALQNLTGELALSKPDKVRWETKTPDETLIVSDGASLWFYDPLLESVTIYSLANAIANTPILLLTSSDEQLWQDYEVAQLNAEQFVITAQNPDSQVKTLALTFAHDQLTGFVIIDVTGQLSRVSLHDFQALDSEPSALFSFDVPAGVEVYDQR